MGMGGPFFQYSDTVSFSKITDYINLLHILVKFEKVSRGIEIENSGPQIPS